VAAKENKLSPALSDMPLSKLVSLLYDDDLSNSCSAQPIFFTWNENPASQKFRLGGTISLSKDQP
jgi:hypothetical protein